MDKDHLAICDEVTDPQDDDDVPQHSEHGYDPVCQICWEPWPCSTEREHHEGIIDVEHIKR